MERSTVGENIAKYRKLAGITQEELGKSTGVSTQAVSRWECGGTPDIELLPAIADRLFVSIDALFGRNRTDSADINELIQTALMQTPEDFRLMRAAEYAWTMVKAVSSSFVDPPELFYDILSRFDEVDRGTCGNSPGITPYLAYALHERGLMEASYAKDFKYVLVMPEPERGFASVMKKPEEYIRLFSLLTKEKRLEMLIYVNSRKLQAFTAGLAAGVLEITEELADEILEELKRYNFVHSTKVETESGELVTYANALSSEIVPFLYFAGEFMKDQAYGALFFTGRKKPIFLEPPGSNGWNPLWKTGDAPANEDDSLSAVLGYSYAAEDN